MPDHLRKGPGHRRVRPGGHPTTLQSIEADSLVEALELGDRELISLVGAGGKTTLMVTLAGELHRRHRRVITTTTTKIFPPSPEESPLIITGGPDTFSRLSEELAVHGHLTWAASLGPQGKLIGVPLPDLTRLWSEDRAEYLINEADGSARLPLKAPGPLEPVVPEETTLFISVFGLSALGAPLNQTSTFRPELISRLTGLAPNSPITVEALVRLAVHPSGGLKGRKAGMRAVCILNQRDVLTDQRLELRLAESICQAAGDAFDRLILSQLKPKKHLTVTRL